MGYEAIDVQDFRNVTKEKGQKLALTKNDFRIMQILMENKGKVVSREDIMIHLWDSDTYSMIMH